MSRLEPLPSAAPRNRTPVATRDGAGPPASFSLPEMLNEVAARRSARPAEPQAPREARAEPPAWGRAREKPDRFDRSREEGRPASVPRRSDRADEVQTRREAVRARDDRTERSERSRADETRPHQDDRTDKTEHSVAEAPSAPMQDTGKEPDAAEAAEAAPDAAAQAQPGSGPPGALGVQLAAGLILATEAGAGPGSTRNATVQGIGTGTARPLTKGGEPVPEGNTAGNTAAAEGAAGPPTDKAVPGAVTAIPGKQDGTGGEKAPTSEGGSAGLPSLTEGSAREGTGPTARPSFTDFLGPAAPPDAKPGAAAQRTVLTDVAVGRVPIEIGLRSLDGSNQFEIRLSPEELGRVDVKLDIDKSGEVRAHLVVERPEALALLTRDRAQLERAFEQAGLRPGDGGIAFSLRDGSAGEGGRSMKDGSRQGQAGRGPASPGRDDIAGAQSAGAVLPRAILSRLGALDLRI